MGLGVRLQGSLRPDTAPRSLGRFGACPLGGPRMQPNDLRGRDRFPSGPAPQTFRVSGRGAFGADPEV